MKSKFLTVHVLILLLSLTGNVFSKALPPGSGIGDVPANVLILLDKSGSMGARMTSGAGVYYPEAVALDSSNGDVYAGQYYTYGIKKFTYATNAVDSSFGSSGIYRGSGNCRSYYPRAMKVHNGFLYVAGYYQHRVFRVNLSTGVCDWNYYGKYPQTLDIQNNTLYSFNRSNLLVRNLSTNTNISCSYSGDLRSQGRYAYGMAVDHNGANMYLQYYSNLYRFTIGSNKCPSTTKSFSTSSPVGYYSFGMKMHPTDDSILYATSYYSHRIYKIVLNSGKTGVQSSTYKGSCCTGTSTNSNVKMYYPRNIDIDATNNRIAVAEYNKNSIQIFDLNLGFIKEIGGSSGTRMSGAHEAIKAIVTDASLTSGVDFGFAYWSSGSSGFQSWSGNITTGTASPCTSQNCLKVRAHKGGAAIINTIISSVNPGGGTDAMSWAGIAQQYYGHSSLSPIDANLSCQNSYVLVIGDGDWYNHSSAKTAVTNLKNQKKIKTFTVAYGGGISTSGIRYFREMAQAGGTNDVIIANTTASLKAQLKAAISQVIASKLSFTAPAITATIEKGGSLYQAQFDYVQNKEWQGTLTRTAISSGGVVNTADSGNWSAAQKLPTPSARKIWSVIPGTDYTTNYNNFTDTNWSEINTLFQQTNNTVAGYHSISDNPVNTRRCASTSGVANGTDDDVKGLINFIRGEDYFDYDADCNLTETRPNPLGDIYHSELIVVSAPNAETAFVGTNQEAYWRSIKGYDAWAASKSTREEIIYVGANDGLLHAFKAADGVEKWAFAPPFVVSSMPLMVNANLNRGGAGGSNAVFGVDGSPVVHDMYFQSPLDNAKAWHTILFVPYGRGGAGFSVLDITDPAKPLHLYSVLNDIVLHKVHVMNQLGALSTYDYIATSYSLGSFIESVQVTDNFAMSTGTMTCDDTGNNQCFKSKTWTFPVRGISKADLTVIKDGSNYTNFTVTTNANGDTVLTFGADITYYGGDSGNASLTSTNLGVTIKPGSTTTGVLSQPEYEYSKLGETWSEPRIFRLPNDGAGDTNIEDDIYVATIGGGYGTQFEGVGSSLFIINLEDRTYPGKIHKVIDIEDMTSSDIVNSVPGTPVVVTADTARGIGFRGALVYTNDFEGKITKFNLTNMSDDGDGNAISLYDNTTLFNSGSTISNGRYMYHSMDATIGQTTNSLWLFSGTGDYERIAASSNSIQNLLLGISDPHYPLYKEVTTPSLTDDLTKCKNTTNDSTGASCPQAGDRGWYITLDDSKKVTTEPTVASGLVYFPIYKPSSSVNKCSLGDAFICAADDECGTNVSSKLGANSGAQSNEKCKYVGQGVLSRIVTFAGKLFANIAGQSLGSKKDLVTINTAVGDVSSYRSSWRQNY
jgi:type IV pilus assembly protein PilY1